MLQKSWREYNFLFTIDRLQFIGNTLIDFEFIDISDVDYLRGNRKYNYMQLKLRYLLETFSTNLCLVQYNDNKDNYAVRNVGPYKKYNF